MQGPRFLRRQSGAAVERPSSQVDDAPDYLFADRDRSAEPSAVTRVPLRKPARVVDRDRTGRPVSKVRMNECDDCAVVGAARDGGSQLWETVIKGYVDDRAADRHDATIERDTRGLTLIGHVTRTFNTGKRRSSIAIIVPDRRCRVASTILTDGLCGNARSAQNFARTIISTGFPGREFVCYLKQAPDAFSRSVSGNRENQEHPPRILGRPQSSEWRGWHTNCK